MDCLIIDFCRLCRKSSECPTNIILQAQLPCGAWRKQHFDHSVRIIDQVTCSQAMVELTNLSS